MIKPITVIDEPINDYLLMQSFQFYFDKIWLCHNGYRVFICKEHAEQYGMLKYSVKAESDGSQDNFHRCHAKNCIHPYYFVCFIPDDNNYAYVKEREYKEGDFLSTLSKSMMIMKKFK